MKTSTVLGVVAGAALSFGVAVNAQDKAATPPGHAGHGAMKDAAAKDMAAPAHVMVQPNEVKWGEAPPTLPTGAKVAVLSGDPSKEGPFVMRAKFPANYKIMPHHHPGIEHLTVISGNFYMGMGEKFDEKAAKKIATGGFGMMQPKTVHYAFTKGETVVQVHGWGPWGITYVNPADDPSQKKAASAQ